MPKITITEKYEQGAPFLATDHVVYIPGFSTLSKVVPGIPTLFTSLSDFIEKVGGTPKQVVLVPEIPGTPADGETPAVPEVPAVTEADKSYLLAYELLKLGVHVLYEIPEITVDTVKREVQTKVEIQAVLNSSVSLDNNFWTKLTDRGAYNIRFITAGAYLDTEITEASQSVPAHVSNMIINMLNAAETRGDAVALIDHKEDFTTKTAVQEYFNFIGVESGAEHAAGVTPWIPVVFEALRDSKPIRVPGTFGYLLAFAKSIQLKNPSWLSIAGARRGRIPGLVVKPDGLQLSIRYGESDANDLQERTHGAISVNPIVEINPYGILIWGNRTLLPVVQTEDGQDGLGAKHFLNIRNLVSSIRKTLFVASRGLTFEQNDDILWINFKSAITPLLEQMKSGGGIADYKLFKRASKAKATLVAVIRIVPIEAVEDFDLSIDLKNSIDTINE